MGEEIVCLSIEKREEGRGRWIEDEGRRGEASGTRRDEAMNSPN